MKKKDRNQSVSENIREEDAPTVQEVPPEKIEKVKRAGEKRFKKMNRVLDRLFGFLFVTVFAIGVGGLGYEYVMLKGPSEALKEKFINTFVETRRFNFIPFIFMESSDMVKYFYGSTEELDELKATQYDDTLVTINTENQTDETGTDAYGLVDEDGDGIIYQKIQYHGSTGYMLVVLDPTRVFCGMPDAYGGGGLTLEEYCQKYNAIGGINAGGFVDDNGAGTGGLPDGITIIDYVTYNSNNTGPVAGLTEDGKLFCGYLTYEDCVNTELKYCVSFGPLLIFNGQQVPEATLDSGINPRTCIGQRADGAIILLAIDGRQGYSIGVSFADCSDIMYSYGCVNAINMDGGSSTCMVYNGQLVNHPTNAAGGTRYLPNAWLVK